MHEMSIAEGILHIALEYAKENQAKKVAKVALRLGEMAGIERESLAFCWESVRTGTIAEDATLAIENVPLIGRCTSCGEEGRVERYNFICPICKAGVLEIISGRELQVAYLEME